MYSQLMVLPGLAENGSLFSSLFKTLGLAGNG